MGQIEDRQNARQNSGRNPERQEVRRYITALVAAVSLVTIGFAVGYQQPDQPGQVKPLPGGPLTFTNQKAVRHFDQDAAWSELLWQCEMGPRVPGTDGHLKSRDKIYEEMKLSCDDTRIQEFTHQWSRDNKTKRMFNIIGEQNWKNAKNRVVLLAHWDTRPTADQEPEEDNRAKPIPGANDGASGVAILLELMRVSKANLNPDLGILYVMVDGEDLGPGLDEMFLGAKYFSQNMPDPKPDYGILLDMVGQKNVKVPVEPNSYNMAKPLVVKFFQTAKEIGLDKVFANEYGPEIYDDHLSLNEAGIPTMDLIDFDYKPWHTLADTPDKCSAESLGKVGKMLEAWLAKSPSFKYPK